MRHLPVLGIALALGTLAGSPAMADSHGAGITGDAEAGAKVFRKCKACHEVGEAAKSKAGPVLNGIVGRGAGGADGFGYSSALTEKAAAEGLIWTAETLDAFLTKPKDYIKGTKMSFAGLRKEKDRANVIAYLAGFTE